MVRLTHGNDINFSAHIFVVRRRALNPCHLTITSELSHVIVIVRTAHYQVILIFRTEVEDWPLLLPTQLASHDSDAPTMLTNITL